MGMTKNIIVYIYEKILGNLMRLDLLIIFRCMNVLCKSILQNGIDFMCEDLMNCIEEKKFTILPAVKDSSCEIEDQLSSRDAWSILFSEEYKDITNVKMPASASAMDVRYGYIQIEYCEDYSRLVKAMIRLPEEYYGFYIRLDNSNVLKELSVTRFDCLIEHMSEGCGNCDIEDCKLSLNSFFIDLTEKYPKLVNFLVYKKCRRDNVKVHNVIRTMCEFFNDEHEILKSYQLNPTTGQNKKIDFVNHILKSNYLSKLDIYNKDTALSGEKISIEDEACIKNVLGKMIISKNLSGKYNIEPYIADSLLYQLFAAILSVNYFDKYKKELSAEIIILFTSCFIESESIADEGYVTCDCGHGSAELARKHDNMLFGKIRELREKIETARSSN